MHRPGRAKSRSPIGMNDDQTMEWLTAHFASERGRAELAQDLLADWRGEAPPAGSRGADGQRRGVVRGA